MQKIKVQGALRSMLSDDYDLVAAHNQEEARVAFAENEDISLILMDDYLREGKDEASTNSLVTDFRESFEGPIVSMSFDTYQQKRLMKIGCTHMCDKGDISLEKIESFLLS